MSTTTAQSVALAIFRTLVQQVGVEMVQLVLEAVTNPETAATTLLDDLSVLAGGVVRDVLGVLEPALLKAEITATYAAVQAAADAIEDTKFPKTE
jgi:uncharacterized membrane protein YeiH